MRCIGVLICFHVMQVLAQSQPQPPLPKEIVAAWEKAGFEACWMRIDERGAIGSTEGVTPCRPAQSIANRLVRELLGV